MVGANDALDDSGSLGRLCALADGPRADLLRATGEVADELHVHRKVRFQLHRAQYEKTHVETLVSGAGDLAEGAGGAEPLELLLLRGGVVEVAGEALLECDGERDELVSGRVLVNPGLDLREPLVLEVGRSVSINAL